MQNAETPEERALFRRSTVLGIVAILLWSATIAVARSLSERVGPLTAGVAVYLWAGMFSIGMRRLAPASAGRRPWGSPRYLLACGALFVLYTLSLFVSIGLAADLPQVLEVGLLNYLWPTLTIVFSLWLLHKRARLTLAPGLALAMLGIYLAMTQATAVSWTSFRSHVVGNPVAYSLALTAAVTWALYSNLTRRWGPRGDNGSVALFLLSTGLVLLLVRLCSPERTVWTARAIAEVLFLGTASALAYTFWDVAMRRGDMVLVASCSYLTPLFSTLISVLYLGAPAGANLWLGCLLVVAGAAISKMSVSD